MLNTRRMSRLLIVASRDQMEPVISALYRQHSLHIEDYVEHTREEYEGFRIGAPLSSASAISSDLLRLRSIENVFALKPENEFSASRIPREILVERVRSDLPVLSKEIDELSQKRTLLENQKKDLEQKIDEIRPFRVFPHNLSHLRGFDTLSVFSGYIKEPVIPACPFESFETPYAKGPTFQVLVVPQAHRSETEKALAEREFQAVAVPEVDGTAEELITRYEHQIGEFSREITSIEEKTAELNGKYREFVLGCDELLTMDIQKAEAPLRFATTEQAFVVEGWVPSEDTAAVTSTLNEVTGGKIFITEIPADPEKDNVPVEYDNPQFVYPSQILMDVYSRPRYTEIDPTLLVSIVFPIFFGLILGDVGYGAVLLVASLLLRKFIQGEEGRQLITVLRNASISTIFFGVVFSEIFGFSLPWPSFLFSRHINIGGGAHGGHGPNIPELMVMSIWIGILHITLGRVIGMVNHARQDHGSHRVKAVLANFGWIAVMWGILAMIWSKFAIPYMPDLSGLPVVAAGLNVAAIIGAVLIVLGIVFIMMDSVLEIVELPTIISHVLSYARLVAVGLSSVAIAMVVNYITIGMFIQPHLKEITPIGVVLILVGVFAFLLGHTLNTALGILGGGLHSIRLHYVEFFTKFYKGGGQKYVPFGMSRKFTEE